MIVLGCSKHWSPLEPLCRGNVAFDGNKAVGAE